MNFFMILGIVIALILLAAWSLTKAVKAKDQLNTVSCSDAERNELKAVQRFYAVFSIVIMSVAIIITFILGEEIGDFITKTLTGLFSK